MQPVDLVLAFTWKLVGDEHNWSVSLLGDIFLRGANASLVSALNDDSTPRVSLLPPGRAVCTFKGARAPESHNNGPAIPAP
jgi:hypothetical protein